MVDDRNMLPEIINSARNSEYEQNNREAAYDMPELLDTMIENDERVTSAH